MQTILLEGETLPETAYLVPCERFDACYDFLETAQKLHEIVEAATAFGSDSNLRRDGEWVLMLFPEGWGDYWMRELDLLLGFVVQMACRQPEGEDQGIFAATHYLYSAQPLLAHFLSPLPEIPAPFQAYLVEKGLLR